MALVNAAKYFGFTFKGRDEDSNIIVDVKGNEKKYTLLNVIEFTSTRKRMTVVVKDPEGRIRVMCKGADSIIIPRLKANSQLLEQTNYFLENFAKEGLRTLILAEKDITQEFWMRWNRKF